MYTCSGGVEYLPQAVRSLLQDPTSSIHKMYAEESEEFDIYRLCSALEAVQEKDLKPDELLDVMPKYSW